MVEGFIAAAEGLRLHLQNWIPDFFRDMTVGQRLSLLFPVAYVLGSIPFGMVIGRLKGVDVTRRGSGNIGATNVGRLLGRKYFYMVFFLDMFKGLLPMLLAAVMVSDAKRADGGLLSEKVYLLWITVGLCAILGHMYSFLLKLKGGKGIATSLGVTLGLFPFFTLPAVGVFAVWLVFFLPSRYVSLASIAAAISFPIWYLGVGYMLGWPIVDQQLPLSVFSVVVAGLIIYKHKSNIRRLIEGKEPHYHPHQKPNPSAN